MGNMSETNNESHFLTKAATIGAALAVGGGAVIGVGQNIQRADNEAAFAALTAEKAQQKAEYVLSAQELAQGMFTIEDVVDSFTIEQGSGVEDPALAVIEKSIGTDLYNDLKPQFYDALGASIDLLGTVQPGQELTVVEADVDPEANNGNEYLVVKPTQINHGNVTELPSPDTH